MELYANWSPNRTCLLIQGAIQNDVVRPNVRILLDDFNLLRDKLGSKLDWEQIGYDFWFKIMEQL